MSVLAGVDLSQHTDPSDVSHLIAGKAWVGLRATLGTRIDLRYSDYLQRAKAAGAFTVAYIFLAGPKRGQPVETQIAVFLATARDADGICLDWEEDTWRTATGLSGSYGWMALSDVRKAIDICHARGLRVGLYASASRYVSIGQDWRWIACYGCTPRTAYDAHQFSGTPDLNRIVSPLERFRARPSTALIHVNGGFFRYFVQNGVIVGRQGTYGRRFSAYVTEPMRVAWPVQKVSRLLVQVADPASAYKGWWIGVGPASVQLEEKAA